MPPERGMASRQRRENNCKAIPGQGSKRHSTEAGRLCMTKALKEPWPERIPLASAVDGLAKTAASLQGK